MFLDFFYLLRARGLAVSLDQWLLVLEGMLKGLHHSSLNGFYYLCRGICVNTEADYDRFDQVFAEYFKGAPFTGEFGEDLMEWLDRPEMGWKDEAHIREIAEEAVRNGAFQQQSLEMILRRLEERLQQQKTKHDTGKFWVGTHGQSAFGNSGWHPGGIRIGGQSKYKTAVSVAGERRYRDFRKDNILDTRGFQNAFRTLRQYSASDTEELEFDVDGTIRKTSEKGGMLTVQYRHPRRNQIKVLMLMDSGGSMDYYARLCSMLFQAAVKSNHFKELHTYYFHNVIDDALYRDPAVDPDRSVPLDRVLKNFGSEYRVIIVSDGEMNPYELTEHGYDWEKRCAKPHTGLDCFRMLLKQYPHLIWLNPAKLPPSNSYWAQTHLFLHDMFPMYDLSKDGLMRGMKKLMAR